MHTRNSQVYPFASRINSHIFLYYMQYIIIIVISSFYEDLRGKEKTIARECFLYLHKIYPNTYYIIKTVVESVYRLY